jgi:hypothetical protein
MRALAVATPQQEIMTRDPDVVRLNAFRIMGQAVRDWKEDTFNHNNALAHYEKRMDLEEGVRHIIGLPVYGAIAGIDAVLDALGFGISEVVEDVTFTTGRVIYRARDGWRRSKIT